MTILPRANMIILGGREERNIANTFLNLAEKSLNDDGEIYCVLPLSFCFGREWFDFRKTLLKESNNMFSAVVMSLPALFQPYTSVSMVLLCLKKDGKGQICLSWLEARDIKARQYH